jgi:hypothetical protein
MASVCSAAEIDVILSFGSVIRAQLRAVFIEDRSDPSKRRT